MIKYLKEINKLWFYLFNVITALLFILGGSFLNDENRWKVVVISVFSSYLAALLYDFLQTFYNYRGLIRRQNIFKKLLNYDGVKRIALILPKHDFKKSFSEVLNDKGINIPVSDFPGVDNGFAMGDVKAASDIYTVFRDLHFPSPKIRTYNDFHSENKVNNNKKWDQHDVFISIGLFSNDFILEMQKDAPPNIRLFELWPDPLIKSLDKKIGIKVSKHSDFSYSIAKPDHNGNDLEYGLISKIKYKGKTFIFIGGMTERGTTSMGHHFKAAWQQIYQEIDQQKEKILDFAFSYKIESTDKDENGNNTYPKTYKPNYRSYTTSDLTFKDGEI